MAAGGGYVAIVEYLVVDKQADIHVKAYNGVCTKWNYYYVYSYCSPDLIWVIVVPSHNNEGYVESLGNFYGFIKSIFYTNLPTFYYEYCFISHDQRIALHVAVEGGHVDIVRFLVGQTPDDINRKDDDGVSIVLS